MLRKLTTDGASVVQFQLGLFLAVMALHLTLTKLWTNEIIYKTKLQYFFNILLDKMTITQTWLLSWGIIFRKLVRKEN